MFIIQTKDGTSYTEGSITSTNKKLTWDDIPKDLTISSLSLTLPFKVKFENKEGAKEINPKLTIKGFKQYYFFNEAVVKLSLVGGVQYKQHDLVAKIVAGIRGSDVYEYRMDKHGNINVRRYSKKELNDNISKGKFDESILRRGA